MSIRVCIFGGGGFIGSHVIEKFSKRKHDVYVVDNFSTGKLENINKKFVKEIIKHDILKVEGVYQIFERIHPDIVLHLAAQPSLLESVEKPFNDLAVNGVGTMNIAKLCKEYGVKKLVYASTSAVMDKDIQSPDDPILPENMPSSPYGISKLVGEMYVRHFMTDAIILRLGNVYGPRQVPLGENQLVPRAIRYAMGLDDFEIYGDGKQTRDYIYVEDVANAFYLASKSKFNGIFYVGTGVERSVHVVLAYIQEFFDMEIDWPIGEARDDRQQVKLNIQPTIDRLGWKSKIGIGKGIQKTVKWWKEKYG